MSVNEWERLEREVEGRLEDSEHKTLLLYVVLGCISLGLLMLTVCVTIYLLKL